MYLWMNKISILSQWEVVFSKCMMTTCGAAGRWSRHRVWSWSMSSGGQHWHSTLHSPHHSCYTCTTPHILTQTCILSQQGNRDTFRDLDFVVPTALSYQHTPSFLGFSCGAAETLWDSCNTSCCIAQYESKPVNDYYIFRRTPWVIQTVERL